MEHDLILHLNMGANYVNKKGDVHGIANILSLNNVKNTNWVTTIPWL